MYVSLGTDLVVPQAGAQAAQARITAMVRSNETAKAAYERQKVAYDAAVKARDRIARDTIADRAAYDAALARYAAEVKSAQQSYAGAMASYGAALATWQAAANKEYAYGQAVSQQAAYYRTETARVLAKWNVPAPAGYGGCLDAQTKAQYQELCRQQNVKVTVKGLGLIAVSPTNACAYAELPGCGGGVGPRPGPAGPKPTPPVMRTPTKPTPPPVRAMPPLPPLPQPPKYQEIPKLVVTPGGVMVPTPVPTPSDPSLPEEPEQRSLAVAGLLGLVVVGGGAAYYFYRKKKKVP